MTAVLPALAAALRREFPRPRALDNETGECARICRIVAAQFGIDLQLLLSRQRRMTDAVPRQVAMFVAHRVTALRLSQIGRQFGRDHTTVLHAVRQTQFRMSRDADLAARVTRCEDIARDPTAYRVEGLAKSLAQEAADATSALISEAMAHDPVGAASAIERSLKAFLRKEKRS